VRIGQPFRVSGCAAPSPASGKKQRPPARVGQLRPDDPVSNAVGNPYSAGILEGTRNSPLAGLAAAGVWAYDQAHGPSPHYHDFGANRYVVDTSGHSDYWQPSSESLRNQARVIAGKYSWVGLEHG